MITLVPPGSPPAPAYADTPGGFCWWYADVVDGAGNGVVVIGALGLPFLPGLADAARRGAPIAPRARPAVNLAVYERGRCTWYGLVELPSSEAAWSLTASGPATPQAPGTTGTTGAPRLVDRAAFGGNVFERSVVGDEAVFRAQLDVALPCGRARGEIVVRGRARGAQEHARHDVGGDVDAVLPRHAWCPQILHARGTVDLVLGDGAKSRRVVVDGAGYHDGNGAAAPLHDLGIAWWLWGRAAFADEERVLYALWPDGQGGGQGGGGGAGARPTAFGVVVDAHGTRVVPDLVLDPLPARANWLGMRRVDEVVAREPSGATLVVGV
jgi:hypothetical protein